MDLRQSELIISHFVIRS